MELPPNFEYFENSLEIENLIMEHRDIICKNKIGYELDYMSKCLMERERGDEAPTVPTPTNEYTFGFFHKNVKKKSASKILYSFILADPETV